MQIREFLLRWHLATYHRSWQKAYDGVATILTQSGSADLPTNQLNTAQQAVSQDPHLAEQAAWIQQNQHYVTIVDEAYPPRLRESQQPPLVLFYAGSWGVLARLCLGIVGARQASRYSREALAHIGSGLQPLTIISGLAAGADTFAHEFALSRGWPTVAVIANGLDRVYPAINRPLQQEISQRGLVITEYPPHTPPQPYQFVARNRIIAGLSHGVLVTEAAKESGSLITGSLALQNNREVFTFPNRITEPLGQGTNALAAAGATLALSGQDIMNELQYYP